MAVETKRVRKSDKFIAKGSYKVEIEGVKYELNGYGTEVEFHDDNAVNVMLDMGIIEKVK